MTMFSRLLNWLAVRLFKPSRSRPRLHVTDTEPHVLATIALPWATSSWMVCVGGGTTETNQQWSTGATGTFRYAGRELVVLDAPVTDLEGLPARVWLEGRDGALRVMVASKGRPMFVRLDGVQETRVVREEGGRRA